MSNAQTVDSVSKPKVPKSAKSINISKINMKELTNDVSQNVSGGSIPDAVTDLQTPSKSSKTSAPTQELAKYQKMSDKEHILKKPDTYIGSIEMTEAETFVYDSATSSIVMRPIHYIPGLYKLFDEGAVNSRDHYVRQAQAISDAKPNALPVTSIDFEISEDGTISITNDGNGIDVAEHPETKLWIPEMIFGHLRTSTNYNKDEKKIVGGKMVLDLN